MKNQEQKSFITYGNPVAQTIKNFSKNFKTKFGSRSSTEGNLELNITIVLQAFCILGQNCQRRYGCNFNSRTDKENRQNCKSEIEKA